MCLFEYDTWHPSGKENTASWGPSRLDGTKLAVSVSQMDETERLELQLSLKLYLEYNYQVSPGGSRPRVLCASAPTALCTIMSSYLCAPALMPVRVQGHKGERVKRHEYMTAKGHKGRRV